MTTLRWLKMPFRYSADFYPKLTQWLSKVFYETLPEAGYEVREEQIYTSFRFTRALKDKQILMAEAGSGTGKTFAYLLPALCYARHTGKPVVIACSSSALQQQLIAPTGDIQALARILNLDISFALATDEANYVCGVRADAARLDLPEHPLGKELLKWLKNTPTGGRAEIPELDDNLWSELNYNNSLDCGHCRRRGYCYVAQERSRVRKAQDFIICSHDIFFRDLWTRRELQQELVLGFKVVEKGSAHLPAYGAVVMDEGHLLEGSALRQLGVSITPVTIRRRVEVLSRMPLAEDKLLLSLETFLDRWELIFTEVRASLSQVAPDRYLVTVSPSLREGIRQLSETIDQVQQGLALHTQGNVNQYIRELDDQAMALRSLTIENPIVWWDELDQRLWVLPRDFSEVLGRELVSQRIPVLITSATLNAGDNFAYFKRLTGLDEASVSQVSTSFNLAMQMRVYLPKPESEGRDFVGECAQLLRRNGGRALILCNTREELDQLYQGLNPLQFDFDLLWEGKGEGGWLTRQFREDESSVLLGTSFWEGIDIPGPSLTMVIIPWLPFPGPDPIVIAKRDEAVARGKDPFLEVDLPAMKIKLRQGMGRLIRSASDSGVVAILDPAGAGLAKGSKNLFPPGVKIIRRLDSKIAGRHALAR